MRKAVWCFLCFFLLGFEACTYNDKSKEDLFPKIVECMEIDSVTSDFPVGFSFLDTPKWQFVSYYNKNRNLAVASREKPAQNWNYKILPTKVGWDSHNRIVMALDGDSCLHVSGNMHNDSLIYFKSDQPLSVSTLKNVFPLVDIRDECSSTYPSFMKRADNELVFSFRKGGSGNGISIFYLYDTETKAFKRLSNEPVFDGLGEMSAYASGPRKGPDGWFHVTWLWRNTPHCETNHHLSYARSKDLINWETIDGQGLELPITPYKKMVTVDPAPPGGGMINGAFRLFFDGKQQPVLVYMKYDSYGNNQLYIARFEKDAWRSVPITNWDYRWEFNGPGSIDFDITIKETRVDKNNNAVIAYWHKKNGEGEITIDLKKMTVIKDEKVEPTEKPSLYPPELLMVQSTLEGMQVHWLKTNKVLDENEFYALRWETLGKRRFYKPPDAPVQPSVLKLYRIKFF